MQPVVQPFVSCKRGLRTAHVCALCTTVVHSTAQNSSGNFPSYPPDNHHRLQMVYTGGEEWYEVTTWVYHWNTVTTYIRKMSQNLTAIRKMSGKILFAENSLLLTSRSGLYMCVGLVLPVLKILLIKSSCASLSLYIKHGKVSLRTYVRSSRWAWPAQ